LATRSPRRGTKGPASVKPRRGTRGKPPKVAAPIEDIEARAARLGITPERVLLEYGRIAFADLRHIIEWGPDGWRLKPPGEISEADLAAISEIVPGSDPKRPRVKLYDRKAALDAIARHLGMFPLPPRQHQDDDAGEQQEEDPREFLARELTRLAARTAEE
jgi:Terminase small subunit